MDRLDMQTKNLADENYAVLAKLFPNAVTETITGYDEEGKAIIERAVDADVLRQEISCSVVEGKDERYQFTWPDKKKTLLISNIPSNKTLRPCKEESVDFENTNNLYIEGDNLDVIKLLQETYLNKIKMIYIDPPYNTGGDFVYQDNFTEDKDNYLDKSGQMDEKGNKMVRNIESNGRFHTDWLNMIYPRIKLAKNLLRDDGVIFISIDDNEVDNLRKICDEIFGESQFIAHLIHKNNSMKNQSKYVGVSTEYILIYAKNITVLNEVQPIWRASKKGAADINSLFRKLKEKGMSNDEIRENILEMYSRPKYTHLSRWNKVDNDGVFMDSDLSRSNGPKNYTIINPNNGKEVIVPNRGWGKSYDELIRLQNENLIWYGDDTTPPRLKSYLTEESESVFDNFIFSDTSADKKLIDKMFGSPVFEFPKSLDMIKQLINLCTDNSDIIMDFFSGSATTAHAVIEANSEKKISRSFILVQINELTLEKSEAYKAGYKSIAEIGKERIRLAGKEINSGDIGFRVLKVDSSNMKDVYYNPSAVKQTKLDMFTDNIKVDRTPEDLLFQVMLDLGVMLSEKIEEIEIAGKKVFNVGNGFLLACFDKEISDETVKEIAKLEPIYAVFRDNCMASDSVANNFDQIFESYSPQTIRKVL